MSLQWCFSIGTIFPGKWCNHPPRSVLKVCRLGYFGAWCDHNERLSGLCVYVSTHTGWEGARMIGIDVSKHQPAIGCKMLLDIGQTRPTVSRCCRQLPCGSSPCQSKPRLPLKSKRHHLCFDTSNNCIISQHLNQLKIIG